MESGGTPHPFGAEAACGLPEQATQRCRSGGALTGPKLTVPQAGSQHATGQASRPVPAGSYGGNWPAASFGAPPVAPWGDMEALHSRVARRVHEFDANQTKEALLELAKGCAHGRRWAYPSLTLALPNSMW